MRPLRLTLNNFLSYHGEHSVDFDGVSLAVLSGPNGSGKSSVIDAIRFALFGHTRGGIDGVITEGEQACRVEFAFALGEETYLVSRQRSRKGAGSTLLSFQIQNGDGPIILDGKSVAETQRRIENTLRLTDELFTVTACANQGNVAAFSQAKPADRKQVLSEILDLGAWERRAELVRQLGRDLAASTEASKTRLQQLEMQAGQSEIIGAEIAQVDTDIANLGLETKAKEAEQADAQEARESLIRDREADRARRKEWDDVTARAQQSQQSVAELNQRLDTLRRSLKDKPVFLKAMKQAEAAQTYAQELEAKRQEDERLRHEAELVEQRQQAAVAEHAQKVEALKQQIAHLRSAHERDVRALEQKVGLLSKQSEVLDRVPCATAEASSLRDKCALVAQAREARIALTELTPQLTRLRAQTPAVEEAKQLQALEAQTIGDAEAKRLQEITARRKQIAYPASEHAEAKRRASELSRIQDALRKLDRAEAQLIEVQTNLESAQAEAKQLADRKTALEAELGPARNWDGMLSQVERSISQARTAIAELQSRMQALRQQRGVLEERLRGAQQAAQEAEQLAATLQASDRRLQVLKVLAQAYGKSGIPALLIEKAVPDLEAVANDVLAVLADGRLSLELRSQRETKAKTLTETLDIVIADEQGSRPYENFSGGEAMRVDLALRIALSMLLASRAGARCELLVLDETCAPLDSQGQDLFVASLQRIADQFATVLVVTHIEALKDRFPYRFEVSKNGQGSSVKLIAA